MILYGVLRWTGLNLYFLGATCLDIIRYSRRIFRLVALVVHAVAALVTSFAELADYIAS